MIYDISLLYELLTTAGARAMTYFRKVTPSWKENQTYVTDADLDVQAYLKQELERHFPDDGLIGEEQNLSKAPKSGERYWVIDPIDGTASFAWGFPTWGIAVGLLTPQKALGGFFYMPATNDWYYTLPDGQVRHNDRVAALKPPDPLCREAVLLSDARFHQSYTISPDYPGKVRSLGSTIAHLCYVATGSADAAVVDSISVWDLAAGLAMLFNNHAVFEYLDGTPVTVAELLTHRKASGTMLAGHPDAVAAYRDFLARR